MVLQVKDIRAEYVRVGDGLYSLLEDKVYVVESIELVDTQVKLDIFNEIFGFEFTLGDELEDFILLRKIEVEI